MRWSIYIKNGGDGELVIFMLNKRGFTMIWFKNNLCLSLLPLQVTDLTLARENQTSFEEYLSNNANANPGIDLTVTVLTTGFWPSYKSFDLNLPAEMVCHA